MRKGSWVLSGLLGACSVLFGQPGARLTFDLPLTAQTAITNAPYSAQEQWDRVQTLEDGTRVTTNRTGKMLYRDAQGRTRSEYTVSPEIAQKVIEITDPLAGVQYYLDTANQVAHRMMLPTAAEGHAAVQALVRADNRKRTLAAGQAATVKPTPDFTAESLQSRMVDGLLLDGQRYRTTYPIGAIGNDQEIRNVSEIWLSAELKLLVTSNSLDPRVGQETFRLANLSRETPDPALFQIPAGYTVVEEHGPFALELK